MPAPPPQPVVVPFGPALAALLARKGVRHKRAAALLSMSVSRLAKLLTDQLPPDRVAPNAVHALFDAVSATEEERAALLTAYEAPRAPRPSHCYRPR